MENLPSVTKCINAIVIAPPQHRVNELDKQGDCLEHLRRIRETVLTGTLVEHMRIGQGHPYNDRLAFVAVITRTKLILEIVYVFERTKLLLAGFIS